MEELKFKPLIVAERKPPLLIAHRGARREAPENTLMAFRRAIELGADGIEFDVLLTGDKVPIVTHNDDLSLLTRYRGWAHATPFSTVKILDAGSHFAAATAGALIPTLAEALELIGSHPIRTIVEIKAQPGMTGSAASLVGGIVSDFSMKGPVMISSSNLRVVWELKKLYPNIPRAVIIKGGAFSFFRSSFFATFAGLSSVHPSFKAISKTMLDGAHERGRSVFVWTVNEPGEFDRCIEMSVDGIITDDIAFARRYVPGGI